MIRLTIFSLFACGSFGCVSTRITESKPGTLEITHVRRGLITVPEYYRIVMPPEGGIVPAEDIRVGWTAGSGGPMTEFRVAGWVDRSRDSLVVVLIEQLGSEEWVPVQFAGRHRIGTQKAEQGGTGQPATRPVDELEGGEKPQPEAEGCSR